MGEDSIRPFLEYENKITIVLGLTSNKGAADFELQKIGGRNLYEHVIESVCRYGNTDNLMFVAGATQATELETIRKIIPDHFLLVPGIGFQGGNLQEVVRFGKNAEIGLLVNASRAIIYASEDADFATEAAAIAQQYQYEMQALLA
jgi:orotidine-5'-phosphate decarboxylase